MKAAATLIRFDALEEQSDPELVAACLGGIAAAWEALINRYKRLIFSIPLKAGMTEEDAADVFQTVCLKLYEGLSKLRDHGRLAPWLVTTTRRASWSVLALRRRERANIPWDEPDSDEPIDMADDRPLLDENLVALQQQQAVREAIEMLPERCRKLLDMLFYRKDEVSYADICREMRMPVSSIGPTRGRCLKSLKKLLEERI